MDKNENYKTFYFISAIAGILLFMLQVGIYRMTIISFKIPFVLTLVSAIIGFFVILKNYRKTYQKKNLFFPFVQSFVSFGLIMCFVFTASNFYFAENNIEVKVFPILKKHTIGTKNPQPAVEIDYEGLEKQLVFYTGQQAQVDSSSDVMLTVKKGFWGYDVFSNIQLK